ncbi:MAG: hypothetical protein ACI4UU_03715 [Clostridia bacterium]
MSLIWEFLQFIFYLGLIVIISKYILVPVLRKLAESLNLKAKTVGNISGIATSVPELLTVSFSAAIGLLHASIYNIISSNIINIIQYLASIYINKNQKILNKKAIKIDLVLVLLTILIPILILSIKMELNISIVPIFILLFLLFYYINHQSHKLYLNKKTIQEKQIEQESKWVKGKKRVIVKYTVYLIIIAVSLYFVGNLLSDTLNELCLKFNISQVIIGILLGFVTSLPELITFIEAQKHHKKSENKEDGVIEATNNLLTSNILNLFIIQSIGAIIYEIFK